MARIGRYIFPLMIAAYAVYAGVFIFRTSFVLQASHYHAEARRYFVLFDDMMISMRYADNFAAGHGLVFNVGEQPPVEGYTNFGWVLYMALWHRIISDPAIISLAIQITGALCMIGTLFYVKRIAEWVSGGSAWVWVPSVLFTAFYLPLNLWSLLGTEVSLIMLLTSLAAYHALRDEREGRFGVLPYLILALTCLIRPDAAVIYLTAAGYRVLFVPQQRLKAILVTGSLFALVMAAQTVFRLAYYGELLPNTYYLKMTGLDTIARISWGIRKILMQPYVLWSILGGIAALRHRSLRLIMLFVFAQAAYSIYVGGDAWEYFNLANRYLSIAVPFAYIGTAYAVVQFAHWLKARYRLSRRRYRLSLAVIFCLIGAALNFDPTGRRWAEALLITDAELALQTPSNLEYAALIDAYTTPEARIALIQVGTIPYFTQRPTIDVLGKIDKYVARLDMTRFDMGFFMPGHSKWDYSYSIGTLKPDVVAIAWFGNLNAWLTDYTLVQWGDFRVYFRTQSPHVRWDLLDARR